MSQTFLAIRSGCVNSPARKAMSASRRRKSLELLDATISMSMPGSCVRNFSMIGGNAWPANISPTEMQTVPSSDWDCPEADKDARVAASLIARAWSSSSRPAGGQYELCAHTFEQCQAEFVFQCGDLSAERGLRAVQCARRGGKRPFFSGHQKCPHSVPIKVYRLPVHSIVN